MEDHADMNNCPLEDLRRRAVALRARDEREGAEYQQRGQAAESVAPESVAPESVVGVVPRRVLMTDLGQPRRPSVVTVGRVRHAMGRGPDGVG